MRCALLTVCLFALTACAGLSAPQRDPSPWLTASAEQRYIVVTIRNSQVVAARAGSSARGYDLAADYGPSATARRDARALAKTYGLQAVDAWPIQILDVHCVVYAVANQVDANALLERMRTDRRVESAQPLNSFATMSEQAPTYSDPYFRLQSNLQTMQVPQAQLVARGAGVRVAVIDTGVDASHPDLAGRVAVQRDFVAGRIAAVEHHGTAVAGLIGARANNAQGIVGIAPDVQLLSLRACWQVNESDTKAVCNSFTLAQALAAAIELRADIVNLSLAGPVDPLLDRLVNAGAARGVIYVGAMPSAPASFPTSIAQVIAVQNSGEPSRSTSLLAPGANVLTLTPGGYDFLNGTSLATASVSGGIALLLSRRHVDRARLYAALKESMRESIDVCAALAALDGRATCGAK